MRIARICDPSVHEPYQSFTHNTTAYVGIPHHQASVLFVLNEEEPDAWVSLQSDGREVHAVQLVDGKTLIALSEINAPAPAPDSLTEGLSHLLSFVRGRSTCRDTRLYKFSVVIQSNDENRSVLATYDFHILCPQEFEEASTYHRQLCHRPNAIAPDTISERTEGRCCPDCRQIREQRG